MAKVDGTDTSFFMNPAAYSQVKDDKKAGSSRTRRGEKTEFASLFDSLRGKTADDLGPVKNMPASEDSVNSLMDEVRDAGDNLISRPLPEEIMRYKQAIRSFINYIVQNAYMLDHENSIPKFQMPGFKGVRGTPSAMSHHKHSIILVVDKKLDDLAARLLSDQVRQMDIVSRLEEIRGLLIDLLQ
jgi:hypothetical protein